MDEPNLNPNKTKEIFDKNITQFNQPINCILDNNRVKLRTKIKLAFEESILNSSSQALANTKQKGQLYLKIFWFICFIVGSVFAIWISINYLINFLSFSVSVSTLYVIESPTEFPAITICNFI